MYDLNQLIDFITLLAYYCRVSLMDKEIPLIAISDYRIELFFSLLRACCHAYDTPKNAVRAVKQIVLQILLSKQQGFYKHLDREPSEYTAVVKFGY